MKIVLYITTLVMLSTAIAYADNTVTQVSIDGTISEQGCKVINGTIMSVLDIQNTPIHVCQYHNKYFKLSAYLGCPLISVGEVQDPETGQKFDFNSVCDEPTTCGLENSWGGYNSGNVGNTDLLDASMVNGTGYVISAKYDEGVCLSEKYDQQQRKITMIADGLWKNETVLHILVPNVLLTDTTVTVDGNKADAQIEEHNPKNETLNCNLCYYAINIPISSSSVSKKIEIGGHNVISTTKRDTPLKQLKSGIKAEDVKCADGFVLVIKTEDDYPACVKPDTAQKLIERGWGMLAIPSIHDGTLSGNVVLAGGPRSGPQVNYEVDVYASNGITIVGKTFSDTQGNYSISLPAGNYTIYAPDYPTKQTYHVSVISGKNTILNIAYGTGYK